MLHIHIKYILGIFRHNVYDILEGVISPCLLDAVGVWVALLELFKVWLT
jgi:hypothetical protein